MDLKNIRNVQTVRVRPLLALCKVGCGWTEMYVKSLTETHMKGKVTYGKRKKRETCILMG